ncbi:MAG: tetraacyldisaccharide 4'-kinase [Bryobacteraceae bacterium]
MLIYFLYRVLLVAASPLILLYWLLRCARNPAYLGTLPERLGFLPHTYRETGAGAIWLHAVSVGEVLTAIELLQRLRLEMPEAPLFVSTATLAGRATAGEKLAGLADGVFYAPMDFVFAVRRVLRAIRPNVVVAMETEIWPNLFREAKRAGCGLLVVNGRISDRAEPRYRRMAWFFRAVLGWPDAILAQTGVLRERFLKAGAPSERVTVGGNLKYDVRPAPFPPEVASLLDVVKPGAVWIAASTMPPDEDDLVIRAFRELASRHRHLLLILAPRKPEMFDTATEKLQRAGVAFLRRSRWNHAGKLKLPGVLLLDTIGELSGVFSRADVVFMGGTIVPRGGHNILEPAAFGKAVVVGPHMENFREMADAFHKAGALASIRSGEELAAAVGGLLDDAARRSEIGTRAKTCAEAERGATAKAVAEIRRLWDDAVPAFRGPSLLAALSLFWRAGAALKKAATRSQRLPIPVISVGNLSMGGTGKTPMVLHLASKLSKPAILTRGYRRETASREVLLAVGEAAETGLTGDEAQIFARSGVAAIGIGPDRLATGRALIERAGCEVAILDDGFQHWRLHRNVDIVLVDALDPLGGGAVFPQGRLREPPGALARAHIFVITRSERSRPGIERALRRYNAEAPIFYAHVVPECWVEGMTGRIVELNDLPRARTAAFCGLANPASFWKTLALIPMHACRRVAFPDHWRYRAEDIARVMEGAQAAVTTEKDWINAARLGQPHVYWLRIRLKFDREDHLLDEIRRRL